MLLLNQKLMNYKMIFILILNFFFLNTENNTQNSKFNLKERKSLTEIIEAHKGKVIYLDFWASWCKPCRKEIIKMKKIKEELKHKSISFIYISLDLDKTQCDNAVKKDGIIVENYLISNLLNDTGIEELNKIRTIPHYIIFDKEGKLVNANAPSPSQKNKLIEQLNKYLKE